MKAHSRRVDAALIRRLRWHHLMLTSGAGVSHQLELNGAVPKLLDEIERLQAELRSCRPAPQEARPGWVVCPICKTKPCSCSREEIARRVQAAEPQRGGRR